MTHNWLAPIRPSSTATVRLICLPYAGGPLRAYPWLDNCLPECVDVWAASLPGRGMRFSEALQYDISTITRSIVSEVAELAGLPYVLFGHSMGALLCFELARAIRKLSLRPPLALLLSGARSPDQFVTPRKPPRFALPKEQFVSYIRSLGGIPSDLIDNPEFLDIVIPALRADFEACETYRYTPEPPLAIPFMILGGCDDPEVSKEALMAWRDHSVKTATVRRFVGDHFFINSGQSEVVAFMASFLTACSGAARSGYSHVTFPRCPHHT